MRGRRRSSAPDYKKEAFIMADNKNIKNEETKKEINLEELENVTGGGLGNTHKRSTTGASASSKSRV